MIRPRLGRRSLLLIALVLVVSASLAYLALGAHRRYPARARHEVAALGWRLEGGDSSTGFFRSSIVGARLTSATEAGISARLGRVDLVHAPWGSPSVTVSEVHVDLAGDPVPALSAVLGTARNLRLPLHGGELAIRYQHRLLGAVELDGVTVTTSDAGLRLHARQLRMAARAWQDVTLAFEPRKEMFLVGIGGDVATTRTQVSCFPSRRGSARWLVDLLHQPARPLAASLGWQTDDAFDSARVAGGISFDIPDDAGVPVQGRVQLVFDAWPGNAPEAAAPLLGQSFSLLSNLVPDAGGGWQLPRVELKLPVFLLIGKGGVGLDGPRFTLTAEGERTCRELRALLPPSEARDAIARLLAAHPGRADQPARLRARWDASLRAAWRFEPGCDLARWPPTH